MPLSAHRLDEYLQSARISVEPDRVDLELSLSPGLAVVDRIVEEIDRDRNGAVSPAEKDAYVSMVMRAIALTVDGQPLSASVIESTFPALAVLRRGDGGIRIRARAARPPASTGPHQLEFRNDHQRDVSVYLANALVPESDRVAVRAQHRDESQRALIIDYVLHAEASSPIFVWLMGVSALAIVLFTGLRYGVRRVEAVIP